MQAVHHFGIAEFPLITNGTKNEFDRIETSNRLNTIREMRQSSAGSLLVGSLLVGSLLVIGGRTPSMLIAGNLHATAAALHVCLARAVVVIVILVTLIISPIVFSVDRRQGRVK